MFSYYRLGFRCFELNLFSHCFDLKDLNLNKRFQRLFTAYSWLMPRFCGCHSNQRNARVLGRSSAGNPCACAVCVRVLCKPQTSCDIICTSGFASYLSISRCLFKPSSKPLSYNYTSRDLCKARTGQMYNLHDTASSRLM